MSGVLQEDWFSVERVGKFFGAATAYKAIFCAGDDINIGVVRELKIGYTIM